MLGISAERREEKCIIKIVCCPLSLVFWYDCNKEWLAPSHTVEFLLTSFTPKQQAEAQEAIIQDVSNLCDVAEAMCDEQEEQLNQSYFDLPIWASPGDLMASLCDDWQVTFFQVCCTFLALKRMNELGSTASSYTGMTSVLEIVIVSNAIRNLFVICCVKSGISITIHSFLVWLCLGIV